MTGRTQNRRLLEAGEALFETGYYDEAEFYFAKLLERDAPRDMQISAVEKMVTICSQVHREDDAERFEQLFRELKEVTSETLPRECEIN